jgi:hypothetical protein
MRWAVWTARKTDVTKLIMPFRSFANAREIFSVATDHLCPRYVKVSMSAIFLNVITIWNKSHVRRGRCLFLKEPAFKSVGHVFPTAHME